MNQSRAKADPDEITPLPDRRVLMWAVAVACLVAGVRLILVGLWGGSAPYLDECNQTGWLHIFASRSSSGIPFAWLFEPHMEHRITTERIFSLGLAALNGNVWDIGVELRAAALLWGVFAGFLTAMGGRFLEIRFLPVWALFVAASESIPHAWENLLWAFQVQFLFVVGFSIVALWLLVKSVVMSRRWWLGIVFGVVACLSQAGGLLVWSVAAFISGIDIWKHRRSGRSEWTAIVVLIVALTVSIWVMPRVPEHDPLHASSTTMWFRALGSLLAWPWSGHAFVALVLWLPGAVFVARWLARGESENGDSFFAGLILWALALVVATVRSRGALLAVDVPPSRYGDALIIGVLANAWVVMRWWTRGGGRVRVRWMTGGLWIALALTGLVAFTLELSNRATRASNIGAVSMRGFINSRPEHEDAYRAYVATRDPATLDVSPTIYPVPEQLADAVDRLEKAGRWPTVLDDERRSNPRWLSSLVPFGTACGVGLAAIGAVLGLRLMGLAIRERSPVSQS